MEQDQKSKAGLSKGFYIAVLSNTQWPGGPARFWVWGSRSALRVDGGASENNEILRSSMLFDSKVDTCD